MERLRRFAPPRHAPAMSGTIPTCGRGSALEETRVAKRGGDRQMPREPQHRPLLFPMSRAAAHRPQAPKTAQSFEATWPTPRRTRGAVAPESPQCRSITRSAQAQLLSPTYSDGGPAPANARRSAAARIGRMHRGGTIAANSTGWSARLLVRVDRSHRCVYTAAAATAPRGASEAPGSGQARRIERCPDPTTQRRPARYLRLRGGWESPGATRSP